MWLTSWCEVFDFIAIQLLLSLLLPSGNTEAQGGWITCPVIYLPCRVSLTSEPWSALFPPSHFQLPLAVLRCKLLVSWTVAEGTARPGSRRSAVSSGPCWIRPSLCPHGPHTAVLPGAAFAVPASSAAPARLACGESLPPQSAEAPEKPSGS